MNKVRLVFLVFISLFVVLISFIVLTYSEHDKVSKYGGAVRVLGHEVLEMRDHITNAALTEISTPYQMSADLVTLEKELQALKDSYQGENTHSTFFQHLPTLELLDQFHDASMSNVDTLDKLVGLSVARQLLLKSMTTQLTSSKPINYHFGAESDLIIQSELLASVLFSGVNMQHSGVDSDLANLSQTFVELNQQHSLLLSQVLDLHSTEYIEHIEHQFTELQDQLKDVTVKLILTLALLTFVFSFTLFILRIFELKRNNLSYQEAADKAERASEAKSLFLATMSHELRTPMNGVLGIAQIIKEDSHSENTRKHAQIIIDSGQHLVTILNDILDFSKVEQGKWSSN